MSDIQNQFKYISKKHGEKTGIPSIRIYVSKIENRIIFKVKTRYYVELLMPVAMELLGGIKNKIAKYENGEIRLIEKLMKLYYNKIQVSCVNLFLINHLVINQKITQKFHNLKNF